MQFSENQLTHIILSDILNEDEDIIIEDCVLEVRRLGQLVAVLGEDHVGGLVAGVQDLDLGVVVLRKVEVAGQAGDAWWVWGERCYFRCWENIFEIKCNINTHVHIIQKIQDEFEYRKIEEVC